MHIQDIVDPRDNAVATAVDSIGYLAQKTKMLHRDLSAARDQYISAQVALEILDYIKEASKPEYHRRFYGLLPAKRRPPPLSGVIDTLDTAEAIKVIEAVGEQIDNTRSGRSSSNSKAAKGSSKAIVAAAEMLIKLKLGDASGLAKINDVVDGVVDIYQATSDLNSNTKDIVRGNLNKLSRSRFSEAEAVAAEFVDTMVAANVGLRKAMNNSLKRAQAYKPHDGQPDAAAKRFVEAYQSLYYLARDMLLRTETCLLNADATKVIALAATKEHVDLNHPLAVALDYKQAERTKEMMAQHLVHQKGLSAQLHDRMNAIFTIAATEKLEFDIKGSWDRRLGISNGFHGSRWYLCQFSDLTLALSPHLEGVCVDPSKTNTTSRSAAQVLLLAEELRFFMSKIDIMCIGKHPSKKISHLRQIISECVSGLEALSQHSEMIDVVFSVNPTDAHFESLLNQIHSALPPRSNNFRPRVEADDRDKDDHDLDPKPR